METPARQQELLSAYDRLRRRSEKMLTYARDANWEALIELQSGYIAEVETLHRIEDGEVVLDQAARGRKADLLKQIIDQDREIRELLVDRRRELTQMILGSRQQLALARTYSFYQGTSEVVEAAQRFNST